MFSELVRPQNRFVGVYKFKKMAIKFRVKRRGALFYVGFFLRLTIVIIDENQFFLKLV